MPKMSHSTRRKSGTDRLRKERKNFTPEQKRILNNFIDKHLMNCYPSAEEKEKLANEAHLKVSQVSDYFINSRRRQIPQILKGLGLDPNEFKKRRQSRNEHTKEVPAKRSKKEVPLDCLGSSGDSGHEASSESFGESLGYSPTRDENEEVFVPVKSNKGAFSGLRNSGEQEHLQKLVPECVPPQDSLCIRTELEQHWSPISSTLSPSSASISSAVQSDMEDTSSKDAPNFARYMSKYSEIEIEVALILSLRMLPKL